MSDKKRLIVKDWNVENIYRDIEFRLPGIMERNEWLRHMRENFNDAEDPGERFLPYNISFPNSDSYNRKDVSIAPKTEITYRDYYDCNPYFRMFILKVRKQR